MNNSNLKHNGVGRQLKSPSLLRLVLEGRGVIQQIAAKLVGVSVTKMAKMVYHHGLPKLTDRQKEKLMKLTGRTFEDLFPEVIYATKDRRNLQEIEVQGGEPLRVFLDQIHVLREPRTPAEEASAHDDHSVLEEALKGLSDKQKEILSERFVEGKTLYQVGRSLGCSKENIRQRQNEALAILRRRFERQNRVLNGP